MVDVVEQAAAKSPAPAFPPIGQARYVLAILVIAYIFSFVDRTILTLLVQPIRADLHITDVQISLLHGLAFAVFYTVLGVPIARLADRTNRVRIISIGAFIWAIMTATCGLARNFGQMFLARVGVGVGEASLSPAAYSILADYFPPAKLTQALSIYTAAAYVGGGLAMIAGGTAIAYVQPMDLPLVGHVQPWQLIFFIVGLPGILVVALVATIKEPKRLGLSRELTEGQAASLGYVIGFIKARGSAYGHLVMCIVFQSMMWNGVTAWMPTFFIRTFHLSPATVGLWAGLSLMICGGGGIVGGGWLAGWLKRRGHTDANHILLFICIIGCLPLGLVMTLAPSPVMGFVLYAAFLFVSSAPYGGAAAAFQEITPNQMRAQISAIYQFGLNLAGIGIGPMVVALLTQKLFKDDLALKWSIPLTVALTLPLAATLIWRGRKPYRAALAATTV